LSAAGKPVAWRGERSDLAAALAAFAYDGDVVLTLGAGDITRSGRELLQVLAAR
jgi:UDP-N-acetylmuramate--alanine ligase